MNPSSTLSFWLEALGSLALQCATVLAVAGVTQALLRSPRWRRATWVAALIGVALVLSNSVIGVDREVAGWLAQARPAQRPFTVRANLPVDSKASLRIVGDTVLGAASGRATTSLDEQSAARSVVWWPAWGWLAGTFAVAVWAVLPRLWLVFVSRLGRVPDESGGTRRIDGLAARLGLHRPVRVFTSGRLAGPVAFGLRRPSVGLPADFWTANSRVEQDAMLAHELAHLAARDPFWLVLADTLVALLWWHPLVWWARRQFRAASEAAADEASVVIDDGPAVLAGCLIVLAGRWRRRGVLGLLGMAGFRSQLGRRVERLLCLKPGEPLVGTRVWQRLLFGTASMAAVAAAVAVPWSVLPVEAGAGRILLAALGEAVARSSNTTTSPTAAMQPAWPASATSASVSTNAAVGSVVGVRLLAALDLPETAGTDREKVRAALIEVLTRRLAKLDRLSEVKCEPEDRDWIRITFKFRDTNTASYPALVAALPTVQKLIEQPGRLEFRPVHSESDELLSRGECPDGCDVLSYPAGPGLPVRRLVVAREPFKGIGNTNITESVVIRDSVDQAPRVGITFDEPGAQAFTELTRASVGRQVAVVLDGELLMAPIVREPILGGKCEITGRFSDEEAGVLAALLAHPLAGPLKLVGPLPVSDTPAANPVAGSAELTVLIQDAKLLYEMGKLNEARAKLEAALRQAPNDRNGMLLVRAPLKDLETIEQLLQVVNAPSPQVMIEAKFVEITGDDSRALGFDWFLGHVPMTGTNAPGGAQTPGTTHPMSTAPDAFPSPPALPPTALTGRVATVTGVMTDAQFRELAPAPPPSATNGLREVRGDQLDWAGRHAANASNITVNAADGATLTGVLNDPQFRVVLRALEQRSGVEVLSAPRVTTLSGRQAQIQVVDLKSVLTGVDPAALAPTGAAAATNTAPFTTSVVPVGPTLDIIPVVAADGYTIQLTVIPTLTEFLGYDEPPKDAKVRVWESGKSRLVDPPLPRFRVRQMTTQAQVGDGQTLILVGFPVEDTRVTRDKVAVLGEIPIAGSLFRSESRRSVKKTLLVFVTATLIDPAGNPVHAANDRPAQPSGTEPQPGK